VLVPAFLLQESVTRLDSSSAGPMELPELPLRVVACASFVTTPAPLYCRQRSCPRHGAAWLVFPRGPGVPPAASRQNLYASHASRLGGGWGRGGTKPPASVPPAACDQTLFPPAPACRAEKTATVQERSDPATAASTADYRGQRHTFRTMRP